MSAQLKHARILHRVLFRLPCHNQTSAVCSTHLSFSCVPFLLEISGCLAPKQHFPLVLFMKVLSKRIKDDECFPRCGDISDFCDSRRTSRARRWRTVISFVNYARKIENDTRPFVLRTEKRSPSFPEDSASGNEERQEKCSCNNRKRKKISLYLSLFVSISHERTYTHEVKSQFSTS